MRRRRRLGAALVAVLVAGAVGVFAPGFAGAADSGLRVVLADSGAANKAAQGESVPYQVRISNRDGGAAPASLQVTLRGAGMKPVVVRNWTGTVAGDSRKALDGQVTPSQWARAGGKFTLEAVVRASATSKVIGRATRTLQITAPEVVVPKFEDVSARTGLEGIPSENYDCNNHTAGAAWGDIDGDKDLDLVVPHRQSPTQVFENVGGHFTERARAAGIDTRGLAVNAAIFADYDNDGAEDLYLVADGANRLYRNTGEGRFRDVTREAQVGDAGPGQSAAWGDYDADGHLDLYVVNYGRCEMGDEGALLKTHARDVLYHARGDGTFEVATAALGKRDVTAGLGFQAAWVDVDDDGRLDLYVVNDDRFMQGWGNVLFHNDGPAADGDDEDWAFSDVSKMSGAGLDMYAMGIGVGDPNRDGRVDLMVANMGPNALLINHGHGMFMDEAVEYGVSRPHQVADVASTFWGVSFADLNNDGWEDIVAPAGNMMSDDMGMDMGDMSMGGDEHEPMAMGGDEHEPMAMDDAGDMEMESTESMADMDPDQARAADTMHMPMSMEMGDQPSALWVNNGEGERMLDFSAASGIAGLGGDTRGVAWADIDRDGRLDAFVTALNGRSRLLRNVTDTQASWLEVALTGTRSDRNACGARVTAWLQSSAQIMRIVSCGSSSLATESDRTLHFGLGNAQRVERLDIAWPSGQRQSINNVAAGQLLRVTEPGKRQTDAGVPALVWWAVGGLLLLASMILLRGRSAPGAGSWAGRGDTPRAVPQAPSEDGVSVPPVGQGPGEVELDARLRDAPVWSDAELESLQMPVVDTRFVTIGGGPASFAVVDRLRIAGVSADDIRVISRIGAPHETYRQLCRNSRIADHDRLRSDSMSCIDNMWGFPSYALREAAAERTVRPLWRVLLEPVFAQYFTPRAGQVYRGLEREARRIGWESMLVRGSAHMVRRRAAGGYFVVVTPLARVGEGEVATTQPFVYRCEHVHLGTGYTSLRTLPDVQRFREANPGQSRVAVAFEPHEHVYRELAKSGGTVVVRGCGITASRVLQQLIDDRDASGSATRIVHVLRTPGDGPSRRAMQRMQGEDGWAYQDFSFPKAAGGGQLRLDLLTLPDQQREQVVSALGGTSTARRKLWLRQLARGRREGWYTVRDGSITSLAVGEDSRLCIDVRQQHGDRLTVEADYLIDCTGMSFDVGEHPLLDDLVGVGGAHVNSLGRLAVGPTFELDGTRSGDGRVHASGSITLGGPLAPVDSFWGHQLAAQEICDDLARCGLGRPIGSRRSIAQWMRWMRNRQP